VRAVAGASGGFVVTNIGDGQALRFNRVRVASRGTYTMTVFYLCSRDRWASVSVNGGQAGWVRFKSSGGSNTVGSLTIQVSLSAGDNTIEFANQFSSAPDLDRITVR